MYRKLLYNDDCILNTISNIVIFDFEEDWKLYLEWANSNIELLKESIITRNNTLNWNGGLPKEEVTETGKVTTTCNESGNLMNRISVSNHITTTEVFHSNGLVRSIERTGSKLLSSSTYSVGGNLMKEMYIPDHDVDSKIENIYNENGTHIDSSIITNTKLNTKLVKRFHDNGELFTMTNYKDGKLCGIHKTFSKKGELQKLCVYDTGNKNNSETFISTVSRYIYRSTVNGVLQSQSYIRRVDGDYDVVDYFHGTTILRAKGVLSFKNTDTEFTDTELQHGKMLDKWIFYHSNGTKESEYIFRDNELETSIIYYEDGSLNHHLNHKYPSLYKTNIKI